MTWDPDGPGPRHEVLVAAGYLNIAGDVRAEFAAMFDGSRWTSMDDGLIDSPTALAAFDDGAGSAIYAIATCDENWPTPTECLLKWQGTYWTRLQAEFVSKVDSDPGAPRSLEVFDDGSGPALFVAGYFKSVEGVAARNIAKWDGVRWWPVGEGVGGYFHQDMQVFDDGTGPALHVASECASQEDANAFCLMRWNGTEWRRLPGEFPSEPGPFAVYDDGTGPALIARVVPYPSMTGTIAKWDGQVWTSLGDGLLGGIYDIESYDDGNGPALYAVGRIRVAGEYMGIGRWDGTRWTSVGTRDPSTAYALVTYDPGTGRKLLASGYLYLDDAPFSLRFGAWDGQAWSHVSANGTDGNITAFSPFHQGVQREMCAAGSFSLIEGNTANNVACWNGERWNALGPGIRGVTGFAPYVRALNYASDGHRLTLIAGGQITYDFQGAGNSVVSWDGGSWTPVADGLNGVTYALHSFNDGTGPKVIAGGSYSGVSGVQHTAIAFLDDFTWTVPGDAVDGTVYALAEFDDGRGPALYAAGSISSVAGAPTPSVARWDGSAWTPVGHIADYPRIYTLIEFDDGTGAALYAGGDFYQIDGVQASSVAKWDGDTWSAVGGGLSGQSSWERVQTLVVHDDGRGPALFATGSFTTAAGVPVNGIARWDGVTWAPLGKGLSYEGHALHSFDDGGGSTLFVGGNFLTAGPHVSAGIARWRCECQHCDTDADGDVDPLDFRAVAACLAGPSIPVSPPCRPLRLDSGPDIDLADFALLQNQFAP